MTRSPVLRLFVPISSIQAAQKFYVDALGFSLKRDIESTPELRLALGDQEIHLIPIPGALKSKQTGLGFHVYNLEKCVHHLISEGHLPPSYSEKATGGVRRLEIPDPAGNIIILIEANPISH